GAPPFRAATREAVLADQLTQRPRPMSHRRATGSAERTVMQALEKDPARRPWINEMLNGLWGEVTPAPAVPAARVWKRPAVIAGGIAGLAALVAVGTWAVLEREPFAARSAVVPPAPQAEPAPVVGRALTSAPAGPSVATSAPVKLPPPVAPPASRVASVPSGKGSVSVLAEVQSQRRTYRVGWLDSGRVTAQYQDLVKQALVGYPRDVTFEYRSAEGQAARLQEFASELVQ